jgi:LysR family glycine cleavage system transcriptional activator
MRAFEVAARHCHIRKAAEELGVTHGAVSRQVKQLENSLGIELFDRRHNRLALTSAGVRLQSVIEESLDRLAEAAVHLDPLSLQGSLIIASTPSITMGWLLRVIGEFSTKYPEIELSLVNVDPQQRDLKADIDVAICYGKPEAGQRQVQELFRERYFPVCSPALLSPERPIEKAKDLQTYPLLHDRHGHWQRWLASFQLEQKKSAQRLYFQDTFQVISAVREGIGIGLADRIEVNADLRNGNLIALFNDGVLAEQSHYLVTDRKERITARASLFVDHLERSLPLL